MRLTHLVACAFALLPLTLAAQEEGRNQVALDAGALSATLSYARQVTERLAIGVAIGGGGQLGVMLGSGTLSSGSDGPSTFVELLSASVFARAPVGGRLEFEGGTRVAWSYHPSTEFETRFYGAYGAAFVRVSRVWIGGRILAGSLSEEAGRDEFNLGLQPVVLRFRWGGMRGRQALGCRSTTRTP